MLRTAALVFSLLACSVPAAMAATTSSFVDKVIFAESSGDPHARPCDPETGRLLSSAFGAGQFIEATWLEMVRKYRPDLAAKTDDEILELRADLALSREMTIRFTEENRTYLIRKGLDPTHAALYLAHFAGARGAVTLLKAHRDSPVEDILSPAAVEANEFLQGHTVATLYAWAKDKMNVEVDPPSLPMAVAYKPEAAPQAASSSCGPAERTTRVATMSIEKSGSHESVQRPPKVRFIRGGMIEAATTN